MLSTICTRKFNSKLFIYLEIAFPKLHVLKVFRRAFQPIEFFIYD